MTATPHIPDDALSYRFVRARGPGGQHVNKTSSAVELRVDLARTGLPAAVRRRLVALAGQRATAAGELVFHADASRSQLRNREDALERFLALVAEAMVEPRKRVPTRPSRAARARRVDEKTKRGRTKQLRRKPAPE